MDVNIEVSNRFASFLTDWDYEQYLLLGGYGSGKSYHVALKIILKLLEESISSKTSTRNNKRIMFRIV